MIIHAHIRQGRGRPKAVMQSHDTFDQEVCGAMVPYTRKSCMVQPAQLGTNVLTARRQGRCSVGVMRGVTPHIRQVLNGTSNRTWGAGDIGAAAGPPFGRRDARRYTSYTTSPERDKQSHLGRTILARRRDRRSVGLMRGVTPHICTSPAWGSYRTWGRGRCRPPGRTAPAGGRNRLIFRAE